MGRRRGSSQLTPDQDQLIDDAIKEFYRTRQKPSVNALRRHVRQLCRVRGGRPPSWDAIKARVAREDERLLLQDREGAEAARARFAPVVGEYRASHALEVVQIDHTKVDVFVVDFRPSRAHRATVVDLGDRCGEPHDGGVLRPAEVAVVDFRGVGHPASGLAEGALAGEAGRLFGPAPPSRPRELIKLRPAAAYRSMAGRILARAECAAAGAGRNRLIGQLMREALDCA